VVGGGDWLGGVVVVGGVISEQALEFSCDEDRVTSYEILLILVLSDVVYLVRPSVGVARAKCLCASKLLSHPNSQDDIGGESVDVDDGRASCAIL
jgi:hypothetical protein